MKKIFLQFFVLLTSVLLLQSCGDSKYPSFKKSENGVYYKFYSESGDTNRVQTTDYVTVVMQYRLGDTVLFDSKKFDSELKFPISEPTFQGDLYDALKLMSPGDSMGFVVVADSFYLKTVRLSELPDFVKSGEPLYYDIKLVDVQSNIEFKQAIIDQQNLNRKQELSKLLNYLRENKISQAPLESGFYFINEVKGRGNLPDTGDICKVNLLVSDLDGNVLFTNSKPLDVEFGKPFDTKGFMLGLGMMREGGKAKLIVPSKIGVGMYGTQGVDGFTTLKYEVELLDISSYSTIVKQKEAEARKRNANRKKISKEEQDRLTVYLNQNVIKEKPLASGMYYIESEKGTGTAVRYGSKLQVHYKLFNLDGKLIDSSIESGQAFSIEMGKGQVIEGWEIGLKKMNVGTTATFIIPSNLAYGKEGLGKIIPPNSTLIFDVLLVSVD